MATNAFEIYLRIKIRSKTRAKLFLVDIIKHVITFVIVYMSSF